MSRQPTELTYSLMHHVVSGAETPQRRQVFMNREMGIVHGDPSFFNRLIETAGPFSVSDHRLGMVVQGQMHSNLNLTEHHVGAGSLVYLGPGTIGQPLSVSPDFRVKGFALFADFPLPFPGGRMPDAFNGHVSTFVLTPEAADFAIAQTLFDALWQVVCRGYDRDTLGGLVVALFNHCNRLYQQQTDQLPAKRTREQDVFERFMRLVNRHAAGQHHLDFYADHLFLSERYLGTVVRKASGVTAKEWIDRALVAHAKVMLRHTDKPMALVADELNFPNASFFSKFFKRLTGQTPLDYRQQGPKGSADIPGWWRLANQE